MQARMLALIPTIAPTKTLTSTSSPNGPMFAESEAESPLGQWHSREADCTRTHHGRNLHRRGRGGQGKMEYLAAEHGKPALAAMRAIKRVRSIPTAS